MPRDPVGFSLVSIQKLLADYYLENLKIHILEFLEAWQTFINFHPYFPNCFDRIKNMEKIKVRTFSKFF